jgi:hypothetical protein
MTRDAAFAAGGNACKPVILGIGADSGHYEQRSPSTRVATDARGCTPTFHRSIAQLAASRGGLILFGSGVWLLGNHHGHTFFPSGIAAAETLRALHSKAHRFCARPRPWVSQR